MEIGLGIDGRLALSDTEQAEVAAEAATLGYTSLWTPNREDDPFDLCARWHEASGLQTGISVLPADRWTTERIVVGARMARERTAGHFILGIGAGQDREAPIRRMRELASVLGPSLGDGPIYLGALGPQMLHLAGERYDGAALNWCAPEQTLWSRERVASGARSAGRDPGAVKIHQYIRVCVDPDVAAARLALAKMVLGYAMAKAGGRSDQGLSRALHPDGLRRGAHRARGRCARTARTTTRSPTGYRTSCSGGSAIGGLRRAPRPASKRSPLGLISRWCASSSRRTTMRTACASRCGAASGLGDPEKVDDEHERLAGLDRPGGAAVTVREPGPGS